MFMVLEKDSRVFFGGIIKGLLKCEATVFFFF